MNTYDAKDWHRRTMTAAETGAPVSLGRGKCFDLFEHIADR